MKPYQLFMMQFYLTFDVAPVYKVFLFAAKWQVRKIQQAFNKDLFNIKYVL